MVRLVKIYNIDTDNNILININNISIIDEKNNSIIMGNCSLQYSKIHTTDNYLKIVLEACGRYYDDEFYSEIK